MSIDDTTYNDIQEQAAKALVALITSHYSKASHRQMLLEAKILINDIVKAVAQAQVDCLSEGLRREES